MDKTAEYIEYINEHVDNVRKAWEIVQPKLTGDFELETEVKFELCQRVRYHDITKFTDTEFQGYRQKFYKEDNEITNEGFFQKAWLEHIHKNEHHWNHWIVSGEGKVLSMPFVCVFEMLLDWFAMSIKFGDTVEDFYNKNKHTMLLHQDTIDHIEKWIGLFKNA